MIAVAAGGAVAARQTPVIRRIQLPVPRELTALHGVTLAQVSDVHVGSYMREERVAEIAAAMNATGADYHVMTGDLLDNDIAQMELSQEFLRSLRPGREVYMCMGNHEYIAARTADSASIIAGLRESGVNVLIDEAVKLDHGGAHLWLGGVDYPDQAGLPAGRRTRMAGLEHTIGQMKDDGAPRIVLAHHPRTFVEGREMQLDLMLSGHTHGGQIVLGRVGDLNFSPVLPFELYHKGLYEHVKEDKQVSRLYVNSGAGGWMPVRINCPPEVTVVELVASKEK
jgi:predicted MPP superfamily phosphohydrolase